MPRRSWTNLARGLPKGHGTYINGCLLITGDCKNMQPFLKVYNLKIDIDGPQYAHWTTYNLLRGMTGSTEVASTYISFNEAPAEIVKKTITMLRGLKKVKTGFNLYVNPCNIVSSERPSQEFLKKARLAQREFESKRKVELGGCKKWKNLKSECEKEYHRIYGQLEFLGLLIFDGSHRIPGNWPRITEQNI